MERRILFELSIFKNFVDSYLKIILKITFQFVGHWEWLLSIKFNSQKFLMTGSFILFPFRAVVT